MLGLARRSLAWSAGASRGLALAGAAGAPRGLALAAAASTRRAPAAAPQLLRHATRGIISLPKSKRKVLSVTPGTLPTAELKSYNPVTPSLRTRVVVDKSHLWPGRPVKSLTSRIAGLHLGGRNNRGRITVRHRKGRKHRLKYRHVDFVRSRTDPAVVVRFEYDPNRSAFIALIRYEEDENLSYIIAPSTLAVGDTVQAGDDAPHAPGNAMRLALIPDGAEVHNVELYPGSGAELARSAGNFAKLISKEEKYAILKLPSGEIRRLPVNGMATIGAVSNDQWRNRVLGKAGASFWEGRRSRVRGTAMNPIDHPHGGGNGRTSGGKSRRSPWGWFTKGPRTRNVKGGTRRDNGFSSKLIIKRRNADKLKLSTTNSRGSW